LVLEPRSKVSLEQKVKKKTKKTLTCSENWSNVQALVFSCENYDFLCIKMKTLFVSIDPLDMVESGYEILESTSALTGAQQRTKAEIQELLE
jgi:hypothetical protein